VDVRRAQTQAAARQAGVLFGAAGALTILNNYVPGSTYLDEAFLNGVGVLCLVVGVLIPRLPWGRWPDRATLAITPFAFALIAVANERGGVSTYSFAPFFILVFMWVGLHHRPGTSLLLAPLAAAAYMAPGLVVSSAPDGALSSVTIAIPACVLVGETIARTVSRLRRAEQRAQRGYDILHRSQALARIGSWEWDSSAGTVEWSPEMYRILGVEPGTGFESFDAVASLVPSDEREAAVARFRPMLHGEVVAGATFPIDRPDGRRRWVHCEGGPPADRPGVVTGFIQDVTATKVVEEELARLALRDDLTGLANRRAFVTVGEQLLRMAARAGETVLVVYADLDGMKAINDRHGHAAGDDALRRAARLLQETFRESDLVARIGGDEFCVLFPGHASEAKSGINRLRDALAAQPPEPPPVALSLGVAQASPGMSIEDVIRRADAAMYSDKALRADRKDAV
jgi:diguanylate cyclase (GGDEF)-like protein/PAS domain S-box-containing protein